MARVPTLQNQTGVQATQAGFSVPAATPGAFGAGTGQALGGVGNALQNVGSQFGQLALTIQADTNREEVMTAVLQAGRTVDDLQYNPETGLLARQGANAKGASKALEDQLLKIHSEASKNLQNPMQRRLFDENFARAADAARARVMSHEAGQIRVANVERAAALEIQAKRSAFLDPMNPTTIATSIEDAARANELTSRLRGESPEAAELRQAQSVSDIHALVVDRLLQEGQTVDAKKHFDANKELIDPETRAKLDRALDSQSDDDTVSAAAQSAFDTFGVTNLAGARRQLDEQFKDDPVMRQKAQAKLANVFALAATEQAVTRTAQRDGLYAQIEAAITAGDTRELERLERVVTDKASTLGRDMAGPLLSQIRAGLDPGKTGMTPQQRELQKFTNLTAVHQAKSIIADAFTNGGVTDVSVPVINADGLPVYDENTGRVVTHDVRRKLTKEDVAMAVFLRGGDADAADEASKFFERGGNKIDPNRVERILKQELSDADVDIYDKKYYGLFDQLEGMLGVESEHSDDEIRQALRTLLTPVKTGEGFFGRNQYMTALELMQQSGIDGKFRLATAAEQDRGLPESKIVAAQEMLKAHNAEVIAKGKDAVKSDLFVESIGVNIKEPTRENAIALLSQSFVKPGTPLAALVQDIDVDPIDVPVSRRQFPHVFSRYEKGKEPRSTTGFVPSSQIISDPFDTTPGIDVASDYFDALEEMDVEAP